MAIIQEHFMVNEQDFIHTYSDRGVMIHGGAPEADYVEASDPAELGRTYTETEIPCDPVDPEEALAILLGEEEA